MRKHFFILLLFLPFVTLAQEVTELRLGLYLDMYYGYDANQPSSEQRLPYLYHHNRHASFNINHGVLSAGLSTSRFRSSIAFQAGTYVQDNYSSEPNLNKSIFDANVGFAVNRNKTIWLDAGIFGNSFIGFEGTWSHSNDNVGHNLVSENVPYYMTGLKGTFLLSDEWTLAVLLLNGWQRIKMPDGASLPSLGTQLTYVRNRLTINWSSFNGTDDPDATRRYRYFNNFYGIYELSDRWKFTAGFDIGLQQQSKGSSTLHSWSGGVFIARYTLNEQWGFGGRAEFYSDPDQVIVSSIDSQAGYRTSGFSVNLDHTLPVGLKVRAETRYFTSPDAIYPKATGDVGNNFFVLLVLSYDFQSGTITF